MLQKRDFFQKLSLHQIRAYRFQMYFLVRHLARTSKACFFLQYALVLLLLQVLIQLGLVRPLVHNTISLQVYLLLEEDAFQLQLY